MDLQSHYKPEERLNGPGAAEKNQHIQVFVRVRPMNSQEKSKHSITILDCPGNREVVVKERTMNNLTKTFTFDKVFGPNSKQVEVYKSVVAPLLEEVLLGYNCTVFAYGQTGTGKTFTMEGDRSSDTNVSWEKDPMSGIVPRALNQLFDELRVQNVEFTVRVSLLELYNEELFDLLAPAEDSKLKTLRLYEDTTRKGSVVIQGLEEVTVHNKHEVYDIMEKGSLKRQTAATLMNEKSSRSHTVFTVTVHIKECNLDGEELLKIGKLNLVDLAGSENIGRSGAVDKRAREAGLINQSLLTLGRVITSLVERAPHVPYRESKLTRLLQDSLGGRTKTSIIATVSPASINLEETLSTLDYAHRAKNITNRPEINQKLTKKAMLKAYTEEIEQLKKDLLATREKNGVFMEKRNYEKMMGQLESQGQDISERITQVKSLEEGLEKKEDELASTKATLDETKEDLTAANQVIENLQEKLKQTCMELRHVKQERDENGHLVCKHQETESKLSNEAVVLLNTANDTTVNLESLYSKLERKKRVEESNLETGRRFKKDLTEQLKQSIASVGAFRTEHAKMSGNQRLDLEAFLQTKTIQFEDLKSELFEFGKHLKDQLKLFSDKADEQYTNTESCVETLQLDLKTNSEEKANHFENFLVGVQRVLGYLNNIIAEMQTDHVETLVKAKNHFAAVDDKVKHFAEKVKDDLYKTTQGVDSFLVAHNNHLNVVRTEVSTSRKSAEEFQSTIKSSISAFQTQLNDLLGKSDEFAKKVEENEAKILIETLLVKAESDVFAQLVNGQILECQEDSAQHMQNINSHCKIFNNDVNTEQITFMEKIKELRDTISSHSNETIKTVNTENQLWDAVSEKARKELKNLTESSAEARSSLTKTITDVTAANETNIVQLEAHTKASYDTDFKMVEGLKDDIKRECDYTSTWAEEEALIHSQQTGMLSEYFDSTYLVDLPTGATPQRKLYEYPSKLSATSPHETILSRFRKANYLTPLTGSTKLEYYDDDEVFPATGTFSDEGKSMEGQSYCSSARSEEGNTDRLSPKVICCTNSATEAVKSCNSRESAPQASKLANKENIMTIPEKTEKSKPAGATPGKNARHGKQGHGKGSKKNRKGAQKDVLQIPI